MLHFRIPPSCLLRCVLIGAIFSNPEILVQLFEVCVQFCIGEAFHDPAMFHVMADRIHHGQADLVIGSRYLRESRIHGPLRFVSLCS